MKLLSFSLKNEAMWTGIFAFAPAVVAVLMLLFIYVHLFSATVDLVNRQLEIGNRK